MNYDEIRESYPQDRGGYKENATDAIEDYQKIGAWDEEETIEQAEAKAKVRDEWDKIADAMDVICTAVNGRTKHVAKAMYVGISRNHRTLQNQAVAAMFDFLRIYKDTAYDLRNWSAVIAAAQTTQMAEDESIVFPFI